MKAAVYFRYGGPEVLETRDIEEPQPTEDGVRVRVRAAALNKLDKHMMRGPLVVRLTGGGLRRPKENGVGADFSGVVEAVGSKVTRFSPGDEVFGVGSGTLAEYVCAEESRVCLKPKGMTFQEAAALPIAALAALQAVRDWGKVRAGQSILIDGASGGVGTFLVQIAKSFGANVTAVCSTRNVERARSLGADRVIDYTKEDFVRDGAQYDLIIDNASDRSLADLRRCLVPNGTVVLVAGPRRGFAGFAARLAKGKIVSKFSKKKVVFAMAKITPSNLGALKELVESGKLTSVVERRYTLAEVPEAMRYLDQGHAMGKLVVDI